VFFLPKIEHISFNGSNFIAKKIGQSKLKLTTIIIHDQYDDNHNIFTTFLKCKVIRASLIMFVHLKLRGFCTLLHFKLSLTYRSCCSLKAQLLHDLGAQNDHKFVQVHRKCTVTV